MAVGLDDRDVASEALERFALECPDAVVFSDGDGRITLFNDVARRVFQYEETEVLGQPVHILMPEPHASAHAGHMARYAGTGIARAIGDVRRVNGRRKDGEVFPVELFIREIKGATSRYAAFIRDTSNILSFDGVLSERDRLTALGMNASILAHELGNPLNNLFLHAQMLGRILRRDGHAELARAEGICDEVRRLVRLLDEFRNVGRNHGAAPQPILLPRLVQDVAHLHLRAIAPPSVEIRLQVSGEALYVLGHHDKLKQVLLNLAKNALEAMPAGGLLTLGVEERGGAAVLIVADSGPGLPVEVDVFEPFTSTKPNGTGLGLPIVKQLVEAHGGRLSWQSDAALGTRFTITLRRHTPERDASSAS